MLGIQDEKRKKKDSLSSRIYNLIFCTIQFLDFVSCFFFISHAFYLKISFFFWREHERNVDVSFLNFIINEK